VLRDLCDDAASRPEAFPPMVRWAVRVVGRDLGYPPDRVDAWMAGAVPMGEMRDEVIGNVREMASERLEKYEEGDGE